jgi:hypothetical protein
MLATATYVIGLALFAMGAILYAYDRITYKRDFRSWADKHAALRK